MKKLSVYEMVTCAIVAAIMCVLGPLAVPIGPIPISLTNLCIYFAIVLLGTKFSLISYIVYLLLGLVGLPVFSGFVGGPAKLFGPTGGYLLGFIIMNVIAGIIYEKSKGKPVITGIGMFAGLIVAYAFGTVWFMYQMNVDMVYALTVCVWPFIPFDIAKIVVAIILGKLVRKALTRAGLKVKKLGNAEPK